MGDVFFFFAPCYDTSVSVGVRAEIGYPISKDVLSSPEVRGPENFVHLVKRLRLIKPFFLPMIRSLYIFPFQNIYVIIIQFNSGVVSYT